MAAEATLRGLVRRFVTTERMKALLARDQAASCQPQEPGAMIVGSNHNSSRHFEYIRLTGRIDLERQGKYAESSQVVLAVLAVIAALYLLKVDPDPDRRRAGAGLHALAAGRLFPPHVSPMARWGPGLCSCCWSSAGSTWPA